MPDLQTQLERAKRFGHNFGQVKVQDSTPAVIQPKLAIGAPGDKYEQEADSVAAQVMSMAAPGNHQPIQRDMAPEQEDKSVQTKPLACSISPLIQRQAAPEEEQDQLQAKPLAGLTIQRQAAPEEEQDQLQAKPLAGLTIQRQAAPEEEQDQLQAKPLAGLTIQRQAAPEEEQQPEQLQAKPSPQPSAASSNHASDNLENQLTSSKGGGSPLPDDVRAFMEPRFGVDFSSVRVHTDSQAVQMNQAVGAQAFTHGNDIYFGAGKSPAISDLTAHELTHVVQQNGGASNLAAKIQRKGTAKKISTPLGKDAKIQKDGSAKLQVATVNVVVKPDTTTKDKEMTGRAQTNCNLDWKTPSYEFKGDTVTKVGTLPPVNMTIQTVYGPTVTAESKSDYGKGTTKEDQQAGKTDLGHHEGSHGTDAMQFLKDHPLPVFTGKEGMTVDEYKQAVEKYNQEMNDYQAKLEQDSKEKTDCVGTKADFCE
jgi:hypothetical protein